MMVRNYANQVYKLFRLYEHGALPEVEWNNTITESKQIFQSPGFAEFKQNNNYFSDLWVQLDARELKPISTFRGMTSLSDDA
jgi:DNA polymerase III psi subunit